MNPLFKKLDVIDTIKLQNDAIIIGLELLIFNLLGERVHLRELAADPELVAQILGDMNTLRNSPKEYEEAVIYEIGEKDAEEGETDEEIVLAALAERQSESSEDQKEMVAVSVDEWLDGKGRIVRSSRPVKVK